MQGNARQTIDSAASTSVIPYKSQAFDEYLTYCALGGMMFTDQGGYSGMPLSEFCDRAGIDEKTTWRWKNQIPDFSLRVRQRREEIVPLARETAAWNRMLLIGMTSIPLREKEVVNQKTGAVRMVRIGAKHDDQRAAVDALKTYLGHYGELKTPVQRQDIKVEGGLFEVLAAAQRDGIIEGETVEPANSDAGTGQEAPSALPLSS